MSFKDIFIWSSGGPFVQRSGTICAISVKCILRNSYVKLFGILNSGSGGNVIKRHFLSRGLSPLMFGGVEPFVQFWLEAS